MMSSKGWAPLPRRYPVFPWILQDYQSASIDLRNPAHYRDLSKPIGAIDEARLQLFQERFDSMDGDDVSLPPSLPLSPNGVNGCTAMT